jgi:hypothetical protein
VSVLWSGVLLLAGISVILNGKIGGFGMLLVMIPF